MSFLNEIFNKFKHSQLVNLLLNYNDVRVFNFGEPFLIFLLKINYFDFLIFILLNLNSHFLLYFSLFYLIFLNITMHIFLILFDIKANPDF